ncbi:gluconokinase [Shinella sp.]|uniref:gluconokinase n=1 Tax=Shinella sp. TaxID=1870904 RepID=UPI0028995ED5|nr:gluconokinase [Shinella sp.]
MPRANLELAGYAVIVMGVSGSGKSTLGKALADHYSVSFVEGDTLHPPLNVSKMQSGIPLADEDRWPWLDAVGSNLAAFREQGVVASCSALRRSYRDRLRFLAGQETVFLYLSGSREVLAGRMARRTGHFMPAALLYSQFETFEAPEREPDVIELDIEHDPKTLMTEAISLINKYFHRAAR